jgi:hypothetical protein
MTRTTDETTLIPRQAAPESPAGRRLDDLDETERYAVFDELQRRMPEVWRSIQLDVADESVVVVPSVSLSMTSAGSGTLMQAMEERALFLLLLLRQPRLRMVYVTSSPVAEEIVEYYLGLLPGVIPSHARARLTMLSVGDASPTPLSRKLLARPRLLRQIRELVPNPEHSHLIPYNTTAFERDVAVSLGIPMYGADPRLEPLGTKSGCRRMFTSLQVPCPVGAEDLHGVDDLVAALVRMRRDRPAMSAAVVKLEEGVSGRGNALLRLGDLPAPGSPDEAAALRERLDALEPEDESLDAARYLALFARRGGIVEERITGDDLTSPSVQMRVLPDGTVELLSTHDQLLGGPSGQAYVGCRFPADPAYSRLISEPAMVIGRHLATLGALGRFAVDFVVVREADAWTPYAIELNLRKGGTTHPFLTMQFLTDGSYDGVSGRFLTANGDEKHLVATDHLEDERLKALTVGWLLDVVATRRLHYDQARESGVVLHMLSSLTECGRIGLTAVGDTADEAWLAYQDAERTILEEAEKALADGPLVAG